MAATDRNSRKEELLAAARDRLTEDEKPPEREVPSLDDIGPEIRYRGKVVRPRLGATPGSSSGSSSSRRPARRGDDGSDDVRAALQKIKDLYHDGLITRAEAEQKRSEILDRF